MIKERCLGLDISRYCTGWCIIDINTEKEYKSYREHMKIIDYGVIDTSHIKEEGKTLIFLEEKFTQLINDYSPTIIVAEQQYVGRNSQTSLVLASMHAMIKLVAAKKNIKIIYYPILTMKSITLQHMKLKKEDGTRKTNIELKQEVQQTVIQLFDNVKFKNLTDDITDSISAVITYVRTNGKTIGKQSADSKTKHVRKKTNEEKIKKSEVHKKLKQ